MLRGNAPAVQHRIRDRRIQPPSKILRRGGKARTGAVGLGEAAFAKASAAKKKPRLITAGATTKKLSYENKNFFGRIL
ncbi:MAG: hypothetical protein DYG98_14370 [Haliscomenobacteraceae bacterium CHB4]|nr:hypothetical protein [Haliscomenobacteraceae bacterium CHB4]